MRRHVTPLNVVATLVLVASLLSSSWAKPLRHLVTGKRIRNNSITSADIRNHTLKAKDFKKGVLKGANGKPGAAGKPGANGQAGTNGQPGAAAAESPTTAASDLWAFRDPADDGKADILASFGVAQFSALGAEAQGFDDSLTYSLNIDQDHDGAADIRYDFRFKTTFAQTGTALRATGPVTSLSDPDLTVRQTYTLTRTAGGSTATLVTDQPVPPPNIGPRATPNYAGALATPAVFSGDGTQAFAGPRKEPDFMDASIYELYGLRPYNNAHVEPLATGIGYDSFKDRNVLMLGVRVPIAGVCSGACTTIGDASSVIGVYATTSRTVGDAQVQTSRAGLPLTRELLTPLAARAAWATTAPGSDAATVARFRDPEPAKQLVADYPGAVTVPPAPRDQLVDFLLRGGGEGLPPAALVPANDELKLNLAVPVTNPPNAGGALAGDEQGFPNGRRLGDDVVDSLLNLYAGKLEDPGGPNPNLKDGINFDDAHPILDAFPYAPTPISGYDTP